MSEAVTDASESKASELNRAQEALRESEERLRLALEAANMGSWDYNVETGVVRWSGKLEAIHGLAPGTFGGTFDDYLNDVHPEDRDYVIETLSRTLEAGDDHHIEYRIVLPGGQVRWVEGKGSVIRDLSGRPVRMAGVCMDVTERKRIESDLREQREVIETVNRVGQMLAAELDLQKLLQALTDAATEICSARFGSFFYNAVNADGPSYMLYTLSGVPIEHFARFPMPRATDLFGPTFRGEGIIRSDDVRQDPRYGKNSPYYGIPPGHLPVVSYLAAPVISRSGEVLGGLFFGHPEAGVFTEREERIIAGLASQAAIAIDNAKLFELVQRERAQLEESEKRYRFLAEASRSLSSSLNYEVTLSGVAQLAVPHIADWCAVDMLEPDGRVRRLAVAHVDPSKVELAEELRRRYPPDKNWPDPLLKVLSGGQSELSPEISDSLLQEIARDDDHLRILRALGLKSFMIVPMIVRGRIIGSITFVSAESRRIYDRSDLALAEDLGRRAALAVDNSRLYQESQEASRLKDEFLATVSHELRTPLNAILGWSRMLRTGRLDKATSKDAVEIIERNAKSQAQLIEDLLDVSRIITGKLRLDVQPVELTAVIESAIDSLHPAADAKGITISKVLDPKAGPASGDPERLQQVVWNLLSNAIKFTPKDGRVQVRLERVASHLEIVVSDTGQGINRAFLPHVFESFRQGDSSLTRSYGGLGLGLAIVRHLVELHGGTVHADSPGEGLGATFTVRLPIMVVKDAEQFYQQSAGRMRAPAGYEAPFDCPPALEGLEVLVVDDEPDTRDLLVTVLGQCGAQVRPVASVAAALASLEQLTPDLIVSDIEMPGEDGYSFIAKLRAVEEEHGWRIPAAALTAHARAEDRMRALSAGFDTHIVKPVEPAELVTVLASLARRAAGFKKRV